MSNKNTSKKSVIPEGRSPMPVRGKAMTKVPRKDKTKEKHSAPVVPLPLGKPKIQAPKASPKELKPKRMSSDLVKAMIDAKYECLAKIVQDDIVSFMDSDQYANHRESRSIRSTFSRKKEAELLFYTAVRELEECKANPSKYFQKFNALCKRFLDDTANDGRIPVSIGSETLRKLEAYFVPVQLTSAMLTAKREIYVLNEADPWSIFSKHLRSKEKDNVVTFDNKVIFRFEWINQVPTKFLPKIGDGQSAYWTDAILLNKDGEWVDDNFENNLKKSGYSMFMEYLKKKIASENLLFYTRARELEQYHNDRVLYLAKFTSLFQELVDSEADVEINIRSSTRSDLTAAYRRFHVEL